MIQCSWYKLDGGRCGLRASQQMDSFPFFVIDLLLERLTSVGDWILDPFAGDGTVALRSSALRRNCIGIEIDSARAARSRCLYEPPSKIITGDCRAIDLEVASQFRLLLTSPPFFSDVNSDEKALALYEDTLNSMLDAHIGSLAIGAYIAIEVLNSRLPNQGIRNYYAHTYTLMNKRFKYIDEIIFCCDTREGILKGFDHFYVLIFQN